MNPLRGRMAESWMSTVGSALLTFIFFWDMLRRYCPPELRRYLDKCSVRLTGLLNPYVQISVHEYLGNSHLRPHEAYAIVEAYLSASSARDAKRLKAEMAKDTGKKFTLSMDDYENTTDDFNGVPVKWISGKAPRQQQSMSYYPEPEKRYYRLKFHRRYKEIVTESYLDHVLERGREIKAKNRQRRLYTNSTTKSSWSYIVFDHPAKFENLAMDPLRKEEIMDDLLTFSKSKDYYARIGKAWKRGYLLFGPPGTGKSTMIAAMANFLDYNVYDLELTSVKDNSELRRLLTETKPKSIIVIEDIDCSLDLTGQRKKKEKKSEENEGEKKEKKKSSSKEKEDKSGSRVTLSGLLNFIDGLWSACAGERLIVFTTNYVDKLDPALTRRGRMDKHIELSYCRYEGFKILAKNYLELEGHELFESVERLIEEVDITPADVAESLMPKSAKEGPEKCLMNLVDTLEEAKRKKVVKCVEAKAEANGEMDATQEEIKVEAKAEANGEMDATQEEIKVEAKAKANGKIDAKKEEIKVD